MNYIEALKSYKPYNEQERSDQSVILEAIETYGDKILTRDCRLGHITASSMILNETHDKVLLVYHNIYRSMSWTGGHADGETDMRELAYREAKEETGVQTLKDLSSGLYSIEILHVMNHIKRGAFVSTHLHLNYTYLFEGIESEELHIKEDENQDVRWIPVKGFEQYISEEDKEMIPVYRKVLREFL